MTARLHLILIAFALAGCMVSPSAGAAGARTLTVFAAASLTDAFTEIGMAFEAANPGVDVILNFAGSQNLGTQILAGAPADVFASADAAEMDALVGAGLVAPAAPHLFLANHLVVILPAANPGAVQQLQDLATPGLKLVLASADVPVGNYTRQSLDQMDMAFGAGFSDRVLANVVSYEDNVKQVVAKVALGEADAGVAYASDAVAASDLVTMDIPSEFNVVARYPMAALKATHVPALAQRFIEYVLSPAGQATLFKWGFEPIG